MIIDINIGDIIVGYHKGYWKVTKIERRFLTQNDIDRYGMYRSRQVGEEINPLIHYVKIADTEGKPTKGIIERCCDYTFCIKASKFIEQEINKFEQLINKLMVLKDTI
jgi:hypothetical protein